LFEFHNFLLLVACFKSRERNAAKKPPVAPGKRRMNLPVSRRAGEFGFGKQPGSAFEPEVRHEFATGFAVELYTPPESDHRDLVRLERDFRPLFFFHNQIFFRSRLMSVKIEGETLENQLFVFKISPVCLKEHRPDASKKS
jgi:hypothetical protein